MEIIFIEKDYAFVQCSLQSLISSDTMTKGNKTYILSIQFYANLLLMNNLSDNCRLVIECKRICYSLSMERTYSAKQLKRNFCFENKIEKIITFTEHSLRKVWQIGNARNQHKQERFLEIFFLGQNQWSTLKLLPKGCHFQEGSLWVQRWTGDLSWIQIDLEILFFHWLWKAPLKNGYF